MSLILLLTGKKTFFVSYAIICLLSYKGLAMSYFAESLKKMRQDKNLTMQELAEKAHVSKSMISKIERDEVQPTLEIANRIATALEKNLSEMLHPAHTNQVVYLPRGEQAVWEGADQIKRRNISPVFEGLKVEWIQVNLPKAATISKNFPAHCEYPNVEKFFLVTKGCIEIHVNQQIYRLLPGDSLYVNVNSFHEIINCDPSESEFYVVIKHNQ